MNPELKEWLEETWINPIEKYGFKFQQYAHQEFDDSGVHTLRFEGPSSHIPDDLKEILTQDDDSQPPATYQVYFGTLFVFIPYFG